MVCFFQLADPPVGGKLLCGLFRAAGAAAYLVGTDLCTDLKGLIVVRSLFPYKLIGQRILKIRLYDLL